MAKKRTKTGGPKEIADQIQKLQKDLAQFQDYKSILHAQGMKADADDKNRESSLILRIRRLEKMARGDWVADKDYRPPKR